jgi:hypothetical protein
MVFSELSAELRNRGHTVSESQIRWAIRNGKVATPPRDGSLRFVFGQDHVEQLCRYFSRPRTARGRTSRNKNRHV